MTPTETISFKVNGKYENEKGVFKVISIDDNDMVIRWEDGEQIQTTVELQRRIAERRQQEEERRIRAAEAGSKSASKGKSGSFQGFAKSDFKATAAGTTWRNQGQLGKAVTQKLKSARFKFKSWAYGNRPEMHVQDQTHRGKRPGVDQAKFYVRLDPETLIYGFYVLRPDEANGSSADWGSFSQWLAVAENEQTIHKLAVENNLILFTQSASSPLEIFLPTEEGWRSKGKKKASEMKTLTDLINGLSAADPLQIELSTTMSKSDALASGAEIAGQIAQLFAELISLYQAAATQ